MFGGRLAGCSGVVVCLVTDAYERMSVCLGCGRCWVPNGGEVAPMDEATLTPARSLSVSNLAWRSSGASQPFALTVTRSAATLRKVVAGSPLASAFFRGSVLLRSAHDGRCRAVGPGVLRAAFRAGLEAGLSCHTFRGPGRVVTTGHDLSFRRNRTKDLMTIEGLLLQLNRYTWRQDVMLRRLDPWKKADAKRFQTTEFERFWECLLRSCQNQATPAAWLLEWEWIIEDGGRCFCCRLWCGANGRKQRQRCRNDEQKEL